MQNETKHTPYPNDPGKMLVIILWELWKKKFVSLLLAPILVQLLLGILRW